MKTIAILSAALLTFTSPLLASARPATLRTLYRLPALAPLDSAHSALLLVDFQNQFATPPLRLPQLEPATKHAAELLAWARTHHLMVLHIRNEALHNTGLFAPGSHNAQILAPLTPANDETVLVKRAGGAFTGTELHRQLQMHGIDTVIIAGLMTHLAVTMSVLDAGSLGYRVIVAEQATATRSLPAHDGPPVPHSIVQRAALAALADRFAEVLNNRQIEELLREHTPAQRH